MSSFHVSLQQAIDRLQHQDGQPFSILLQHGNMRVEYYAPRGTDNQSPHTQDEIYIISCGSASFDRNGVTVLCKANDVLFVPKGMPHKFFDMSDDFGTWVIFYGEESAESIH
jgi:mannose-6-phosphate isomerase-like protein (cupin superfamily)